MHSDCTTLSKRQKRRGAVVVMAAFCLVIVVACLAFAADWGYMVLVESELHNAADSAALSGARALPQGRSAAIAAAEAYAGKNFAGGQEVALLPEEDVEIGLWDSQAASFTALPEHAPEAPNAVRVTCRRTAARGNPLNLFFARVIGTESASLQAFAVGTIQRHHLGLITGLDFVNIQNGKVDSYDSSFGSYVQQTPRDGGDVCSNGPISIGPVGAVKGNARPGQGCSVNRPENVTGSTEPRDRPIAWETVDGSEVAGNNDNYRIPGSYLKNGGLHLGGKHSLVLQPGTYYFPNGIHVTGQASIEVTGATRIVMGGSSNVAGNGIVNATTVPANLRIEMTDGDASFAGNAAFHADVYGPTAAVNIRGNGGFYGAVFGKSVTFSGAKAAIHADEALRRRYDQTARATLAQ